MSNQGNPIAGGFCITHLRCMMACSDGEITRALPRLPPADLARLRKLVARQVKGETSAAPERKEAV